MSGDDAGRSGARDWAARVRGQATPGGISLLTGLAAATSAEIWLPALLSGGAAGAAGVIAGLGGNLLASVVEEVWSRVRQEEPGERGEDGRAERLRALLQESFEWHLSGDQQRSVRLAFQRDLSRFLQTSGALEETRAEPQLHEDLVRALEGLGHSIMTGQQALFDQMLAGQDRVDEYAATQRAAFGQLLHLEQIRHSELREFMHAQGVEPGQRPVTSLPPYPGLASLGPAEAAAGYFHGRDAVLAGLLTRLAARAAGAAGEVSLLVVTGPSGVGKTSLLRAGLVPAVEHGLLGGSWPVVQLTPGHRPLRALAVEVSTRAGVAAGSLEHELATRPEALRGTLAQLRPERPDPPGRPERPGRVLIVVDQAEELFTAGCSGREREAFLRALTEVARQDALVLLSFRADFYAHFAALPGMTAHLEQAMVVPPLGRAQFLEVIEGPARAAGLTLAPGLARVLLEKAGPESLPLLAHTLRDLYENRSQNVLTLARFRELGGLAHAVSATADALYEDLHDDADRAIVRTMLLSMVSIDENGRDTRQSVTTTDLLAQFDDPRAEDVLHRLTQSRLVTSDRDTSTLAHETIITAWPRLQNWLRDDRGGLRLLQELRTAATYWNTHRGEPGTVWGGSRLDTFQAWAVQHPGALTALDQQFLGASLTYRDAQLRLTRRRQRNLQLAAATFAVLFALASGLALLSYRQTRAAEHARNVILSDRLIDQAREVLRADPRLATLLALEADRLNPGGDSRDMLTTTAYAPITRTLSGHSSTVKDVAWAPDGATFATVSEDRTARIWDAAGGRTLRVLTGHTDALRALAYSPDGRMLATSGWDGTIRLWDPATGRPLRRMATSKIDPAPVFGVAFSPDGRHLATADNTAGTARIWDVQTGRLEHTLTGHTGNVMAVAYTTDGARVITGSFDTDVRLWDARTGKSLHTIRGRPSELPQFIAVNPDGTTFAVAGTSNTVRVWGAEKGENRGFVGRGDLSQSQGIAFSPDATTLATAMAGDVIQLWDLNGATSMPTLSLDAENVSSTGLTYSPDGRSIAIGLGNRVRIWTLGTGDSARLFPATANQATQLAYSPDGILLATVAGLEDGRLRLWDARTATVRRTVEREYGGSASVAFSPDGTYLVTGDNDGSVQVREPTTGRPLHPLAITGLREQDSAFGPDHQLAVGYGDGSVRIWDLRSRQVVQTFTSPMGKINALDFTPDGSLVAVSSEDSKIQLWDAHTGELVRELTGHDSFLYELTFSADGTRLASASLDGTARIWDVTTGRELQVLEGGDQPVQAVAFAPDGASIATGGWDGYVRIWDTSTGNVMRSIGGRFGNVSSLAYTPDGTGLVLGGGSAGPVQVWDTRVDISHDTLCARAGRNLTRAEWAGHIGGDYHPTCDIG